MIGGTGWNEGYRSDGEGALDGLEGSVGMRARRCSDCVGRSVGRRRKGKSAGLRERSAAEAEAEAEAVVEEVVAAGAAAIANR